MAIFDYKCPTCGHIFEVFIIHDKKEEEITCPKSKGEEPECEPSEPPRKLPSKFSKHVSWSKWRAV